MDTPAPPLTLLHTDARCVAVHKPAGLLVHRSALDAQATEDLLTRLRAQLGRPLWPVHRLDKGTSGVLLLALDADAARHFGDSFMQGRAAKRYRALVRGWPAEQGRIDRPLARDPEAPSAGQPLLPARTDWQTLLRLSLPLRTQPAHEHTRLAVLALQPHSGRRHQIRRHAKALAHPLIGDSTHGKGPLNRAIAAHLGLQRLWLQAEWLCLPHPEGGLLRLQAAPDADWARLGNAAAQPMPEPALEPAPLAPPANGSAIDAPTAPRPQPNATA